MNRALAKKWLNWGYAFFMIGFFIGLKLPDVTGDKPAGMSVFLGYVFWSAYWGYRIIYNPFNRFFDGQVLYPTDSAYDFVHHHIRFKYQMFIIKLLIGAFVGFWGGAIYQQFKLSKIAYF